MSLVHLTSNLALLGFAVASLLYLGSFQRGDRQQVFQRVSFALFLVATIALSASLFFVARDEGFADVTGQLLTAAIAWLAVVGHLRFNTRLIGAFVAPLATLILLMKSFFAPTAARAGLPAEAVEELPLLMQAHIAAAIVGQAFAIIACAVSILYLWQQNLLKKKLLDQMPQNLPAIDRLSTLLVASLWSGFVFLTLSLLSGAICVQSTPQTAHGRALEAKIIWAIAVWLWYLATLLARNVFNRPTKRLAQMSLGGFLLLALSYFGIGFFRPWAGG